jgi:hypothetical protein
MRQLTGDIHRAVAKPDDEDLLAAHVDRFGRIAIGLGMQDDTGELSGVRRIRPAWVPLATTSAS